MSRLVRETNNRMTRRTFMKKSAATIAAFLGLSAVPFYSYYGERNWIETVRVELGFPSLPAALEGMRIAHFSDVHFGYYFDKEQLQSLTDMIMDLQPDLIAFTGDLFESDVAPFAVECIEVLSRLRAPLGAYAVPGNHDYYTAGSLALDVYRKSGFRLLVNSADTVSIKGYPMQIVGMDDMLLGKPNIAGTFSKVRTDRFTILLAHEPDFALDTSRYRVDLQLSGHTHGGQVRLPFVGELMTVRGGKQYVSGLYPLDDRADRSYVYVNRGIGTTHIPVRFMCRPELTLITLRTLS